MPNRGSLLPFQSLDENERTTRLGLDESGNLSPFTDPKLSFALPGFVNDLIQAVSAPGRATLGQMPESEMPGEAINFAMQFMGPGMGSPKPSNALGVFGGRGAKTADTSALAKAMSLESQGFSAENIWQSTGWFKGKDDKWKFEIPDTSAKLKDSVIGENFLDSTPMAKMSFSGPQQTLGDVIDHPELFAAYPELASVPVSPMPIGALLSGIKGASGDERIQMAGAAPGDFLSTLLHETQHTIQDNEGFGIGGNVKQFLPPDFDELKNRAMANREILHGEIRDKGIDPDWVEYGLDREKEEPGYLDKAKKFWADKPGKSTFIQHWTGIEQHPELMEKLKKSVEETDHVDALANAARKSYRMLAGEVEARNVQERASSTGDYETFPHATTGYPQSDQIVRFGDDLIGAPVQHDPFALTPIEHNPFGEKQ